MLVPMAGTACTTACKTAGITGTQGLVPTDRRRGTLRLILRPSPGGTPMPAPMAGTACTTTGTTGTQGLALTDCGRGTPRLILRPSTRGPPTAGTTCTKPFQTGTPTVTDGPFITIRYFCNVLSPCH